MINRIKRLWKGIKGMFGYEEIKNILGKDVALSESMVDAITTWKAMFSGAADWIKDAVKSLRIEKGICREFADAVVVEIEASVKNNDNLDKVLQKSIASLNKNLQCGLALGLLICVRLAPGVLNM